MFWDFRGMDAEKFAKHHIHHLEEYAEMEKLMYCITNTEIYSEMFAAAFMLVDESEMLKVRDALKPNRAEYFDEE